MSWRDFVRGAASIMDFTGSLGPKLGPKSEEALANDWRVVGNDLRRAMESVPMEELDRLLAQYKDLKVEVLKLKERNELLEKLLRAVQYQHAVVNTAMARVSNLDDVQKELANGKIREAAVAVEKAVAALENRG